MYRGYKTYRHFLNAKLHALAVQIVGESESKDYLRVNVEKIYAGKNQHCIINLDHDSSGVRILTDTEAANLYKQLISICKIVKDNVKTSKVLIGADDSMTLKQRKAIIKIAKYGFKWSAEATFSFILSVVPARRKRLSGWEIKNSKLIKLYGILSSKDADKIIKRLEKIEKRNEAK